MDDDDLEMLYSSQVDKDAKKKRINTYVVCYFSKIGILEGEKM